MTALFAGSPAALLRRGVLALSALTTAGIAVELGLERHWTQPLQLVAWGATALLLVAVFSLLGRPSRGRVRFAQLVAAAVVALSVVGVWAHVDGNYDAGSLDYRYAATWDTLGDATRWWLAATKSVGPSPVFAPGALAEAALGVLLATVRHPALGHDAAG